MSGISWWRSWHGAPTDHKWAVIAVRSGVKVGAVSAIAWALFDYASQQTDRGSVAGFDTEEYAVYSGFDEVEIAAVIQAMNDKGIISNGRLTNWEKRQPKREDDNSNERVRRFRELKRNVTQCNAPEKEKDTETDTDKEEDREESDPLYPPLPETALYTEVTGLIPDVVTEQKVIEKVRAIRAFHHSPPHDRMIELMTAKYSLWKSSRTKDGRLYNPSNPDWLDWCVTGYSPVPANGSGKPLPSYASTVDATEERARVRAATIAKRKAAQEKAQNANP